MRPVLALLFLLATAACGGPILQNAPAPNPTHVAAAAAAAAGAMTLADPHAAAHKAESRSDDSAPADKQAVTHVPHDVLDRLDAAEAARRAADANTLR